MTIFTDSMQTMKRKINYIFILGLVILIIQINACNSQTKRNSNKKESVEAAKTKKSAYELANEFLDDLKKSKTDTIIFYKRICINCCDFFNIFWSNNGQRHLTKFYSAEMKSYSKTIDLKADTIFNIIGKNFTELKNAPLKGNGHRHKDGTTTSTMIDHYCYSQLSIYTMQDSIVTDEMKDHDFDKYTDYGFDTTLKKGGRETNDSYKENINSKWNLLLRSIENQLELSPEIERQ